MADDAVFVTWEGLAEFNTALKTMTVEEMRPLFERALSEEATVIFDRSQYLVPVRTGVLRASGHVTPPKRSEGGTFIEIGYGGPAAGYAMWVHESFAQHTSPTQRKYLERPVQERSPYIQRNLAVRINDMLKKVIKK